MGACGKHAPEQGNMNQLLALEINHHRVWLCVAEPIRVSPILLNLLACALACR
jgi:hypothetical protein